MSFSVAGQPVIFLMSGGNFLANETSTTGPGIWFGAGGTPNATAPSTGSGQNFAYGQNSALQTPNLTYSGGAYSALTAGYRVYLGGISTSQPLLMTFYDYNGVAQVDLRFNGSGMLTFTHNGTLIGSGAGSYSLVANAWNYIEVMALAWTQGGFLEVRVNSVAQNNPLVASGSTAAITDYTGNGFAQVGFNIENVGNSYGKDFYVMQWQLPTSGSIPGAFPITSVNTSGVYTGTITGGGSNAFAGYTFRVAGFLNAANNITGVCTASTTTTLAFSATTVSQSSSPACIAFGIVPGPTYLGDISVVEIYPNAPGVNSAWTANAGPFTLTSVNTAGVYQGTITGGTSNAYLGYNFNITGFTNGANNPTGVACTASTASSITFASLTTITETHAGSAAFQCIVQAGINQTGTRPNGDVAYISDSTTNDISDYGHQTLTLMGTIPAVSHVTYAKKDDAGIRQIKQTCLSSSASELGQMISLGNSYVYYTDVIVNDPNTAAPFTTAGFNAATFGVREIT